MGVLKKGSVIALLSVMPFSVYAEQDINCDNPQTTIDVNACAFQTFQQAQATQEKYLQASYAHNAEDPALISAMKAAQQQWQAYRDAQCSAVYTQWREGTIRGLMALSCKTSLTEQRTHEIWTHFLTYMDSTPPVLPEPEISQK